MGTAGGNTALHMRPSKESSGGSRQISEGMFTIHTLSSPLNFSNCRVVVIIPLPSRIAEIIEGLSATGFLHCLVLANEGCIFTSSSLLCKHRPFLSIRLPGPFLMNPGKGYFAGKTAVEG